MAKKIGICALRQRENIPGNFQVFHLMVVLRQNPRPRVLGVPPLSHSRPWLLQHAKPNCAVRAEAPEAAIDAPLQLDMPTYTRVEYKVNWISSRTMRSAKAQEAILCGKSNKDTAEEVLEEAVDEYRIEIVSPDMMPFESMEEEEIRQNTSLTFKKAQKKATAHDVVIRRITGQKRIISMVFMFEKKSENDGTYLTPDEKEIEFLSRAGNFSIKVKFQPAKMSTKFGPDL